MANGPDKKTSSDTIDKINFGKSFNILSRSNAQTYVQSTSQKDIVTKAFRDSTGSVDFTDKENNEKFFAMLANVFQSITTKGLTTFEIIEYIESVVSSMDLAEGRDKAVLATLFEGITFFHSDYSKTRLKSRKTEVLYASNAQKKYGDPKSTSDYDVASFLNTMHSSSSKAVSNIINVNSDVVNPTKRRPSMSAILLDDERIRVGTRNLLEISSFFNLITTLEISKAYPFFSATFILPNVSKQDSGNIFKTATLNQFMFGSRDSGVTENYNEFEGKIIKDDTKIGVNTNLSIFMHPQTMINMNEKIGHRDNYTLSDKTLRITSIHDSTRPFMTLKDFTIDVSPTKGLMSFKTGKISLVLHDRTRMVDIAPFIKPDLFGAFGAEIAVEYGWISNSGKEKNKKGEFINPIGAFLDSSRCIEKYIITNSQFTIENNGQVNINLSIAMKGPIDVRQTTLEIGKSNEKTLETHRITVAIERYNIAVQELNKQLASGGTITPFNFNQAFGSINHKKLTDNDKLELNNHIKNIEYVTNTFGEIKKENQAYGASEEALIGRDIRPNNDGLELLNSYFGVYGRFKLELWFSFDLLPKDNATAVLELLKNISIQLLEIKSILESILEVHEKEEERKEDIIYDFIGGALRSKNDMFYNKTFRSLKYEDSSLFYSEFKNKYISFGSLIASLLGTHMTTTGKYDEVQLIFHTVNDKAGWAGSKKINIASIPILKNEVKEFIKGVVNDNRIFTIESFISQIVINFIIKKDNIMYGLSDLYTKKDSSKEKKLTSPIILKKDKTKKDVKEKLNTYYGTTGNDDGTPEDPDPQLIPPSIHITFDALTDKESDLKKTICRITFYDRNDNPYQSMSNLYNKKFNERTKTVLELETLMTTRKIRQARIKTLSTQLAKEKKQSEVVEIKKQIKTLKEQISTDQDYYKSINDKVDEITKGKDAIFTTYEEGGYTKYKLKEGVGFDSLKEKYKTIIPSATFATQNTALISASVATVNEAKLNTVYITRADRNNVSELNQKVLVDMPLRILPAQASVELIGCPWVNFGQYIFLDFETGTTIDNTYAVTGIQHTISPGKFSTRLSLSYGDVYGKYEGVSNTLAKSLKAISDIETKSSKVKKMKQRKKVSKIDDQDQIEVVKQPEESEVSLPAPKIKTTPPRTKNTPAPAKESVKPPPPQPPKIKPPPPKKPPVEQKEIKNNFKRIKNYKKVSKPNEISLGEFLGINDYKTLFYFLRIFEIVKYETKKNEGHKNLFAQISNMILSFGSLAQNESQLKNLGNFLKDYSFIRLKVVNRGKKIAKKVNIKKDKKNILKIDLPYVEINIRKSNTNKEKEILLDETLSLVNSKFDIFKEMKVDESIEKGHIKKYLNNHLNREDPLRSSRFIFGFSIERVYHEDSNTARERKAKGFRASDHQEFSFDTLKMTLQSNIKFSFESGKITNLRTKTNVVSEKLQFVSDQQITLAELDKFLKEDENETKYYRIVTISDEGLRNTDETFKIKNIVHNKKINIGFETKNNSCRHAIQHLIIRDYFEDFDKHFSLFDKANFSSNLRFLPSEFVNPIDSYSFNAKNKSYWHFSRFIDTMLPKSKGKNYANRTMDGGEYIGSFISNLIPKTKIPEEWKVELPEITDVILYEAQFFRNTQDRTKWRWSKTKKDDKIIYAPTWVLEGDTEKRWKNTKNRRNWHAALGNEKVSAYEVIQNYFLQIDKEKKNPEKIPWSGVFISFVVSLADAIHKEKNQAMYTHARNKYNPKISPDKHSKVYRYLHHKNNETFMGIRSGGHTRYSDYALRNRIRNVYAGWYLIDIKSEPGHKVMLGNIFVRSRSYRSEKSWNKIKNPINMYRSSHGDVVWKIKKIRGGYKAYLSGGNTGPRPYNCVKLYTSYILLNDDKTIKDSKGYTVLLQKIIKK